MYEIYYKLLSKFISVNTDTNIIIELYAILTNYEQDTYIVLMEIDLLLLELYEATTYNQREKITSSEIVLKKRLGELEDKIRILNYMYKYYKDLHKQMMHHIIPICKDNYEIEKSCIDIRLLTTLKELGFDIVEKDNKLTITQYKNTTANHIFNHYITP
jgi:hypothetical protein